MLFGRYGLPLSRRLANRVNRHFSGEVRAARNKAALKQSSSSNGTAYAILAVCAGLGYCVWDINNNREGVIGSQYWGSPLEQYITSTVKSISQKVQEDVYMPTTDRILPDFPDAPCYGNVPPGTPAPPLLVVDLEKTLIGSVYDAQYGWRHAKRPGVDQFINALSQYYEICILSENDLGAVAELLQKIDPDGRCHKFGNAVLEMRGTQYRKRLDYMNREMRQIILIDDNPDSYEGFEDHCLRVKPYTDVTDKRDRVLLDLIPLLQAMVHEANPSTDFRVVLARLGTHDAQEAAIEYQMRLSRKRDEEYNRRNMGLGRLLRGGPARRAVELGESSLAPSMSDLVGGGPGSTVGETKKIGNKEIDMNLATEAMSVPRAPASLTKAGQIERPEASTGSKKKGALFSWLDEAAKRNEEYEAAKREKMNEIYQKRHMAMMQEKQQQDGQF